MKCKCEVDLIKLNCFCGQTVKPFVKLKSDIHKVCVNTVHKQQQQQYYEYEYQKLKYIFILTCALVYGRWFEFKVWCIEALHPKRVFF